MKIMEEKDIKQHYEWFKESCKKSKQKPISYELYKKELLQTKEKNETKEGKEQLNNLSKGFNEAMGILK